MNAPAPGDPAAVLALRLDPRARPAVLAHFLELSKEDRRMRFGSTLAPEAVAGYVERLDFVRDAVFAVHDHDLALAGVGHLAFGDGFAELGLSVLPGKRNRGIGGVLLERAALHARNRLVAALVMHCSGENDPILRVATRHGMDRVVDGGEVDAHLALPGASPATVADEILADRAARHDYAVKACVRSRQRIHLLLARGAVATPQAETV